MTTYTTHLDVKYGALELIDLEQLVDGVTDEWYNQTLCRVNESVVRIGVLEGEYHWHSHDHEDEFFCVLDGALSIDVEGERTVELTPWKAVCMPQVVRHRPRSPHRTVVLMVEPAAVVPTGD